EVKDFQQVDDWRIADKKESSGGKMDAKYQTSVKLMQDDAHLYVRFENQGVGQSIPLAAKNVFPNGDHIELLIGSGSSSYYFTVGPSGNHYTRPSLDERWQVVTTKDKDSWIALMAIPFESIGVNKSEDAPLKVRFG